MTSATMTSRQHVQAALAHEEPDRVPLALGGGPYGLLKHLDLGEPVPPFRTGHSISYLDDRLLERLGTDLRYCWPGLLPNSPVSPGEDEDTFYDSYGQVWNRALPYYYTGAGLLKEAASIDEIERLVRCPPWTCRPSKNSSANRSPFWAASISRMPCPGPVKR